jgi:hypothetical protein
MSFTPRFGFTTAQWDPSSTTHTTRSENSGSNSVAVGDVVIVAVPYRLVGNTAIALSDNLGNTWTEITAASFISTSDSSAATRFYYSIITVAGTCTITATATTAASFFGIFAYCYSGLDTTSPFHVAATFKRITSADGSDAGAPSNSVTITSAPVLQLGYLLATSGPSNGARWGQGTGFTNRLTGQKSNGLADFVKFEDARVTSTGSITATFIGTSTSGNTAIVCNLTFLEASSGTGSGTIAGAASSSVTGGATISTAPSIAGSATVAVGGESIASSNPTIAGTSTATAEFIPFGGGLSTIAAFATVDGTAASTVSGESTLAGTAAVDGTAVSTLDGVSTLAGAATVDGTGVRLATGYGTISGAASVDGTGSSAVITSGYGTINGAATVDGTGTTQTLRPGNSNIDGVASVSGAGQTSIGAVGALAGTSSISAAGKTTVGGIGNINGIAQANGASSGAYDLADQTITGTPSFDGWIYSAYLAGNMPSGYLTAPTILGIDMVAGKTSGGEGNCGDYLTIFGYAFGGQLQMGKPSGVRVFFRDPLGDNVWYEVANYRWLMKSQAYDANQTVALCVQLGALGGAANGRALDMKLTVNGTDSFFQKPDGTIQTFMPACFTVQPGRILFISHSGDDNTCLFNRIDRPARYWQRCTPNSSLFLGPWANTTPMGEPGVRAGDTLVIMGDGTWTDHVGFDNRLLRYRSHTGTAPNGAMGNGFIHVVGYPGPANGHRPDDVHYVDPPGGGGGIHGVNTAYLNQYGMYWSVSNIHIECNATTVADGGPINFQTGAHNARVHNCVLGPWPSTINPKCGGVSGQGYDCVVRFNKIQKIDGDRVQQLNHGVYLGDAAGVCSKRWDVSYNDIVDIYAGSGVQFNNNAASDTFDGNKVHHNRIKNVAKYCLNLANSITSADCYSNLLIDPGLNCIRFDSLNAVTIINVCFNTCYQTRASGAYQQVIGNTGGGLTTGTINVTHNTVTMASGHVSTLGFTNISSTDTAVNLDENLWYDHGAVNTNLPAKDLHGIYGDPKFTDPANDNFTCQSGGAGLAKASRANALAMWVDYFGVARPFTGTGTPSTVKNDLGATQGVGT